MSNENITTYRGGCLCGGVSYTVTGPLRDVMACHCTQCRKTSGHYVAATQCEAQHITIKGDSLRWYRSSERAQRGFCGVCGSNLFWRRLDETQISIFAGTLEGPTHLKMTGQIYTNDKGDYYDLPECPIVARS